MRQQPTYVAILAGGSGTRFWPVGRVSKPKQMLALAGDDERPLLRATVDRLQPLSKRAPLIVAPGSMRRALRGLLPDLKATSFLWEPQPRNTAAAVALAAYAARAEAPGAPVLVVPADQYVSPLGRYRTSLRAMAARARRFDGIVTLGLTPTRAATGYGYLERGRRSVRCAAGTFYEVKRFREKPSARLAGRMSSDGRHSWNGGTFAFRPEVFIEELERLLPELAAPFERAFSKHGTRAFPAALRRAYTQVPTISVDHGVMEQADQVEVLVSDIEWDDLGSWDAAARHRSADEDGNRIRGDVTAVDTRDCVVDAESGHVALVGVKDLIVVRTGDTVLVARRGKGEDVRKIVARLQDEGREDLLS
jgi:mannose-1-phosphate guanylyltransferase